MACEGATINNESTTTEPPNDFKKNFSISGLRDMLKTGEVPGF